MPNPHVFVESLEPRALLSAYFVAAAGGSDQAAGSAAQPFATIQRAAAVARAGDTVYIHGGVYRETVHPANSGSAGAPITFKAYGDGPVAIDGADPISGWTRYQGSIYAAPMPATLGEGNDQVFLDSQMMNEARFPNVGPSLVRQAYTRADSVDATVNPDPAGLSTATIHSSDLTDPGGSWVGATVHIAPGQGWVWQTGTIISYSPGQLTYTYHQLTIYEVPKAGNPFYISGSFQGLDSPGEWYRDPTTRTLYLWAPAGDSPAGHVVDAKVRPYAFDLSGDSYIRIDGLTFFGCTLNTDTSSNHDVLTGITATYVSQQTMNVDPWNAKYEPRSTGLMFNGNFDLIDNSTITYSSGDGIFLGGSNNTARDCTISEVDYIGGDLAGITIIGNNNQAVHNTIYDAGRSAITQYFCRASIRYNLIHDYGLQTSDCGGTYTWQTDGQGSQIAYNVIYNSFAGGYGNTGVMLDDDSSNFIVHHNVTYNVNTALKMNFSSVNNRIFNNTLIGTDYSLNGAAQVMTGSVIANNIFNATLNFGTGATRRHNLSIATSSAGFVDPSAGDFELQGSSPAVNAGVVVPYAHRYVGSHPDEGAYEFGTPAFVAGAPPTRRDAHGQLAADTFDASNGARVEADGQVQWNDGDWIEFANVDFGSGASSLLANVAVDPRFAGQRIEVHLDSPGSAPIGFLTLASTSNAAQFTTQSTNIRPVTGVHNVYVTLRGVRGTNGLNWIQFS